MSVRFILLLLLVCPILIQANVCSDYFHVRAQNKYFDSLLEASKTHGRNPHFWIEALRTINEDPNSFPYAQFATFGKRVDFKAPFRAAIKKPEYNRHLFFGVWYRRSLVDMPKVMPQNKVELAEFLAHFAYATELQISNRTPTMFPLEASYSYLTARYTLETRRLNRLERVRAAIENSQTPLIQKNVLRLYLVYSKIKTVLKIQWFETELRSRFASILPHHYIKDVNYILQSYDRDIATLLRNLKILANHEVHLSSKSQKEKHWAINTIQGVFRFILQPLWQLTLWEPLSSRSPQPTVDGTYPRWSLSSSVAAGMKYLVDTTTIGTRFTAYALFLSFVYQGTMDVLLIDSIRNEILKRSQELPTQQIEVIQDQPNRTQIERQYKEQIEDLRVSIEEMTLKLNSTTDPQKQQSLREELEILNDLKVDAENRLKIWQMTPPESQK